MRFESQFYHVTKIFKTFNSITDWHIDIKRDLYKFKTGAYNLVILTGYIQKCIIMVVDITGFAVLHIIKVTFKFPKLGSTIKNNIYFLNIVIPIPKNNNCVYE